MNKEEMKKEKKNKEEINNKISGYPSIDRPWLKYYKPGVEKIDDLNLTYYQYYKKSNCNHLNRIGLEFYGKQITRRDVIKKSDEAAIIFKKILGIKKRDQILMGMLGIPEAFYQIMGLSKIDCGANLMNITYTKDQILDSVKNSEFDVFVILDVFYDLFKEILESDIMKDKKIVVVPFTNTFPLGMKALTLTQRISNKNKFEDLKNKKNLDIKYWDRLEKEAKNMNDVAEEEYDPELAFLTVYSSGTTGKAKGIDLPINSITYTALNHELAGMGTNPNLANLHKVPINFSTGVNNTFLLPPLLKMIDVLDPVFNRETIGKSFLTHKHKIGVAIISNEMWEGVSNTKLKKDTLSELQFPMAGGDGASSRRQQKISKKLEKYGCKLPLYSGAGCSEVGACATVSLPKTDSIIGSYKPGTAGIPLPQVNVRICDEDYNELPYNTSGEITYSTPMMMIGYKNDPDKTKKAFYYIDSEKYYKTGDIGYVDEDGFVTYRGRKTKYIKVKNKENSVIKQYLFEIEEKIKNNENVMDCEAVGIGDGELKLPVMHVQLDEEFSGNIENLIKSFYEIFRNTLPDYALPVAIKIREDFPNAKSGKRDVEALMKEEDGYLYSDANGNIFDCSFVNHIPNYTKHIELNNNSSKTLKKCK